MVISVVVNASPLRYSEYALDAADNPADYTAYRSSDRACYMIALRGPFLGSFLGAANNALSMCRHGHCKKDECQ
jgi:hypothetical protein